MENRTPLDKKKQIFRAGAKFEDWAKFIPALDLDFDDSTFLF